MRNLKKVVLSGFISLVIVGITGFNMETQAGYLDVLNVINSTANTVNSVNRAGRGTMSTVEYTQRFTDRQQDRQDRKRAEKSYNESAEQEYYRTIQETQSLRQRSEYSNL